MNIYDIAKKAEVSIATVSRILNKKGNVKKETQQRVLAVMKDYGYKPNAFARALGLNSIKAIGVLCSDVSDLYYAKAVSVIEKDLREQGYDVTLHCTGLELDDKKKAIKSLLAKQVDAIILVGSIFHEMNDNTHIQEACAKVPIIIINGEFEFSNTYSIYCDEEAATEKAIDLLVERGHDNIIYLYDIDSFSGQHKLAGFKNGLKKYHIQMNEKRIIKCARNFTSYQQEIFKLIDSKIKFSALITSDDIIAAGAIKALQQKKLNVPKDVAIIGMNNSIIAECTAPAITSIDNKVEALCTDAVRTLFDVFNEKDVSQVKKFSANIVYRESFLQPE